MPTVRPKDPVALLCSDLHLSDKPPVARAEEEDWYGCMEAVLKFITKTYDKYEVPVIFAGDLFHKAKSPPKLEILAMHWMQAWQLQAIPGQHDLPAHRLEAVEESSYGVVLRGLGILSTLSPECPRANSDIKITGFPFGSPLSANTRKKDLLQVAVIHQLIWKGEPPFPGAPESGNVKNVVKELKGFDVIVAGDNHQGFVTQVGDTTVVNCGSVMRRAADQVDYQPHIYILHRDGSVKAIPVPIDKDKLGLKHLEIKKDRDERVENFVKSLRDDAEIELSFEKNLDQYFNLNKVGKEVQQTILAAMED